MAPLTARTQNLKPMETLHAGLHQRPEGAFSHDHLPHGSPHVNSNGRNSYRERDFSGPFGKRSSLEGH